jgi:hypothetical protein
MSGLTEGILYRLKLAAINIVGTSALTSVFSIFVETVINPPTTLTIESALTEGTQTDSSYTSPTSNVIAASSSSGSQF